MVAVSDVEFQNGFRHDLVALGALCRQRGVLLAVDATQSLGVLPVDAAAWQADVVAAHGYKWLMAFHGIAALFVSPTAMERIEPTVPGRSSVTGGFESLDYALDWHPDARRYQSGGPNWLGAAAVAASLSLTEEVGIERASAQALAVADRVVDGLRSLPVDITSDLRPEHRSSIVSFTLGSAEQDRRLRRRGQGGWRRRRQTGHGRPRCRPLLEQRGGRGAAAGGGGAVRSVVESRPALTVILRRRPRRHPERRAKDLPERSGGVLVGRNAVP